MNLSERIARQAARIERESARDIPTIGNPTVTVDRPNGERIVLSPFVRQAMARALPAKVTR